jgi:hypothetical protein
MNWTKKQSSPEQYIYGVTATAKYDKLRKFLYSVLNDAVASGVRIFNTHQPQH